MSGVEKFFPEDLRQAIVRQTEHALRTGALQPIVTEKRFMEDGGVRFLVRVVPTLQRKDAERAQRAAGTKPADPFLCPEPDLLVGEVSPTHRAVLNKYNVIEHHLLLVTREFQPQERLLDQADFDALARCLGALDGLGFYNGGEAAGASQAHKHLQLVPLPLAEEGPLVPVAPLMAEARGDGLVLTVPGFPFRHALARLEPTLGNGVGAAARLLDVYHRLLAAVGVRAIPSAGGPCQSGPYNLLLTREWMLVVPRSREGCEGISVNALGFAGALFLRSPEALDALARLRPMGLLVQVGLPPT
jgi:ATP adenylyltransferase